MLVKSLLLLYDLCDLSVVVLEVGRRLPVVQVNQHVGEVAAQTGLRFV